MDLSRKPQWLLSKKAIVATRDVVFGLARMYELMGDALPWETRVFRSALDARRWLEREESKTSGRSAAST